MKCDKPMCWLCVWRHIVGPGNDPTISCGHPRTQVRKQFAGSSTAETCQEYLEDDPKVKVRITRETRETLMRGIHQMAVDDGHYTKTAAILDYFLPDTWSSPTEVKCDEFTFVAEVGFGGNEGIYLNCYAQGKIHSDGDKGIWRLGTYKTLDTSLAAMQTLSEWGGTLTYFARRYLWEHHDRFLSDRELRAKAIREHLAEKEEDRT